MLFYENSVKVKKSPGTNGNLVLRTGYNVL